MPAQSSTPHSTVSERLLKARQRIATAFAQCLRATGTSHAAAARSMAVTKRTVGNWVRGSGPISVERIIASRRLSRSFTEHLCFHEHEQEPYLAREMRGQK